MNSQEEASLRLQFLTEMNVLQADPQRVRLDMSKTQAWLLLSTIQLALCHEDMDPHSDGVAALKEIATVLQGDVAASGALEIMAGRGWRAVEDVRAARSSDGDTEAT